MSPSQSVTSSQSGALALRRLARPTTVETCADCGTAAGASYATCAACYETIERFWRADWQALLTQEEIAPGTAAETLLAQVVLAEVERHPWTVLDFAMTLAICEECAQEVGGGPVDCTACAQAWGNTLGAEILAEQQGLVSPNEHALHVGRMVLRHPHRQSTTAVQAWQLSVPRLLTGWLPSIQEAQRWMALIKQNRLDAVQSELRRVDAEIERRAQSSSTAEN